MMHDDADEVREGLNNQIEGVLDSLSPGWKRKGNIGYLTAKSAKDLGSFRVSLHDGGPMPRGSWRDFRGQIGGGSAVLVSHLLTGRKDDYKQAFAWARDFLGIKRENLSDEDRGRRDEQRKREAAARRERQAEQDAAAAKKRERRIYTALEVWGQCKPLKGTHGDRYLQARGLPAVAAWPWDPAETIRFHPGLEYELDPSKGNFPAVVAAVRDAFGDITSVWRIYLDRQRAEKAPVDNPKVGLGPAAGGAVRIGGDADDIGGAEGVESSLGAYFLEDCRRPVWAFLSTSGMVSFEPPIFVRRLRLWQDSDFGLLDKRTGRIDEPPGIVAARTLRSRLVPSGVDCLIQPDQMNGDPLDLYVAWKAHETRSTSP